MKIIPKLLSILFVVFFTTGCESESSKKLSISKNTGIEEFDGRKAIELAHKKGPFLNYEAIQFDLILKFRGKERLNGRLTLKTNSTAGRIDFSNGKTLLYNQSGIFHSDSMGTDKKLSFDAYTWSYFFLLPYKLSDPGTFWAEEKLPPLSINNHNTYKLSFAPGTGEAPDDWYKIYSNESSNLIEVASYIVTANKSKKEAEEDPHAIQYSDYNLVENIPVAHNWTFWGWTQDSALTKPIGSAELSNIEFIMVEDMFFQPTPNLIKVGG